MPVPRPLRAVTFDCWNTLLYEVNPGQARALRIEALIETAPELTAERAAEALRSAKERHWNLWRDGFGSGSIEMAQWTLEALGLDRGGVRKLAQRFSEASLEQEIRPLEGAQETLVELAARGIRRGLICDTGFSPGRVVRQLLDRCGLLDLLEVHVFSDEAGVPKPHPRVFQMALEQVEAKPEEAVHVGDMRRSDVAGARGIGMGSVRIRWQYDDTSDDPEADAVAESHAHLQKILRLG